MKRNLVLITIVLMVLASVLTACDKLINLLRDTADSIESDQSVEEPSLEDQIETQVFEIARQTQTVITQHPTATPPPETSNDQPIIVTAVIPEDLAATTSPPQPTPMITQPSQNANPGQEIRHMGLSFTIPDELDYTVAMEEVEGNVDLGDNAMGPLYPDHIKFHLNPPVPSQHFHSAYILVFPMHSFYEIYDYWQTEYITLNKLRDTGDFSMVGENESLPFLPIFPAAQMIHSNEKVLTFSNGSGIRYLTQYGQAYSPFDTQNMFYTFQGVTDDGNYYVVAIIPLEDSPLPYTAGPFPDDSYYEESNFKAYARETRDLLNGHPASDFLPNLEVLDRIFESLQLRVQ